MRIKYLHSGIRGIAAVLFATLVLVIPVALLASITPGRLAVGFVSLGTILLLLSLLRLPRIHAIRTAGKGLLATSAILAIIHFTGLLEPLYRKDGWLLLGLETEVYPLEVRPGDVLTYALSTTTDDPRPAMARLFTVDGVPYRGMLLYSFLPTMDGNGFVIDGNPIASLTDWDESQSDSETVYTVVYAKLELPVLNSVNWNWSATYTAGWDVVGVITSNGDTHSDLGAGETLTLQYSVVVPQDHPAGKVRAARAGLSYRDPQWGTYQIHELRCQFDGIVTVLRDE